jgi:glutamate-1-semialdehyde 2,1-aminomutase
MMKTSESEKLFEQSKKIVPGGVHSPVRAFKGVGGVPRFIQKASGVSIFDVDGNEYLDFCMSWGPLLFGHQDPEIADAVKSALSRGWSFGTAEPYSLELAEWIVSKLKHVEKIRFVNSGTEAVMSALRVARAVTGRNKILKFDGCYHGHVDSLLVRAGSGLADMATPGSAGVSPQVASHTLVCPLNDLEALKMTFEKHGHEIAVAVIEPLPANNGLLIQTDDFLKELASHCKKHGSLLLFDEVISGFRVGLGGMAEQTGITPDLVCYGKVIGGGFPVGAYAGKAEIMDWVAPQGPVYQAGTLSANPVAMTAGLAMLKKLVRENPYESLQKKTEKFVSELKSLFIRKNVDYSVQSYSSLFWLIAGRVQTRDRMVRSINEIPETQKTNYAKLFHSLLNSGIYLAPSGYEVSFVSTAHKDSDFERLLDSIEKAL